MGPDDDSVYGVGAESLEDAESLGGDGAAMMETARRMLEIGMERMCQFLDWAHSTPYWFRVFVVVPTCYIVLKVFLGVYWVVVWIAALFSSPK